MLTSLVQAAYIIAAVLFVMSLAGLSKHETARAGNAFGIVGMVIALVATITAALRNSSINGFETAALIVIAMAIGGSIGVWRARRVEMTGMPELVAILHSFVGLAAVIVGFNSHLSSAELTGSLENIHEVEVFLGVFIGAVTFTGSIIAFLKLSARIKSTPLMLPKRHLLNLLIVLASAALLVVYVLTGSIWPLLAMTVLALLFGLHLVASIGGGDMPVVVSMLNSYSGWAAAAAGFMLGNDLLIITGALVGSSGAILSYIMCRGMNRSFVSVMLGGFGTEAGSAPSAEQPQGEVRSVDAPGAADLLEQARKIIIIPGYGLAVAQAQHSLAEVVKMLREKGADVRFAIH